MIRVRSVKPIQDHKVEIVFSNKETRTIDLESYLYGPIFEPVRNDRGLFNSVKVDKASGTIYWKNGADIDPDVLYGSEIPARVETKVSE